MAVRTIWQWLGSPASVRTITAGMVVYALILGALIVGYSRMTSCLAHLGNVDAAATARLRELAGEERRAAINLGQELAAGDPARVRAAAKAWIDTIARNDRIRAQYPPSRPPSQAC